ncbi:PAS domain S-box protein [Leptothoe spongobia]|uniref:histidine kinase n=1 Tax=Leptothoe spongobia TAU-MAC 1115 TaxID=1967444 RepID=A0A947GKR8_9CYAN|nr:PAS domain S-box protein [Leptothoe spongobia]MBT9317875.1 PAS domain S-box protein [Leptothoe spongobia TAU-MAC 1115]
MTSKVPLRLLLIIPFVLQMVGAVGIISWLSFRSGQQSTNQLAYQLREEITQNTQHHITDILTTATTISTLTTASIQADQLDLKNIRVLEELYWTDLTTFNSVRGLGVGNANGDLMGLFRQVENGKSTYYLEYTATGNSYVSLTLNPERQVIDTSTMERQVDARERPWYQAASEAGESVWTQPYPSIGKSTNQTLLINYSTPIFDEKLILQGVTSIILDLSHISEILSNLDLGPSGHVFILQRTGELIGTSDGKAPISFQNQVSEPLRATDSTTQLIQASAVYLNQKFDNRLEDIRQTQQLDFLIEGQRQFLHVAPLSTENGIDWLVVVAMPEADFMAKIYANTRATLFVCLGTLVIAIILGFVTARWIANPIKQLSQAATHLSEGDFDQPLKEEYYVKEVGLLAQSFQQMTQNLRDAFTALKDSDSRLRMALEGAQIICWDYSLETQQALCFGQYTQDRWQATSWQTSSDRLFISYSQTQLRQAITAAIQDGGQIKFEHQLVLPNQNTLWALASGRVITDKLGNPTRIMGVSLNVSDRKAAEQQIQQEKEKLRDAIEFAPFPIMIHAEDGKVLQINTVWTEITGYSHQDIPTIRDWANRAYGAQAARMVENVILKKYELKTRWDEGEFTITTCDGSQRIWQFSSAPLGALPDGRRAVISMAVDVTQRRQAEIDLRTSEKRYATLASTVPVGIFRTDMAGDYIYANERCLQLIDSSLEAALGQGWAQRLYADDRARVMNEWSEFLQGNRSFQLECRFQRSDGQVAWVYGQAIAERDTDGQITGYVGTITDISDRKLIEVERETLLSQFAQLNLDLEQANQQLEDYSHTLEQKVAARTAELEAAQEQIIAQEKLASLGTLTAGIAHELSNPLNFVKNFAEGSVELSQDLLDTLQPLIQSLEPETLEFANTLITDLQENATTIRHHSLRAEQIIASMMQHAHTDYEQDPPEAVPIEQLINRAVKLASHSKQSQDNNFNLSMQTDYGVNLAPVKVIPSSLLRAFINLIDNAYDAMYLKQNQLQVDGQSTYIPTLLISAHPVSQGVEIHIRDNGCGIEPSIKDKIMDPFFTTKTPGKGTGLGLSITHDIIVKQHQGTLAIHTELGKFTEFVLTLPNR